MLVIVDNRRGEPYDDAGCEGSVEAWPGQSRCTPPSNPLVPVGARSLVEALARSEDDDDRSVRLSDDALWRRDAWVEVPSGASGVQDHPFRVGQHLPEGLTPCVRGAVCV